jgi:hypothetical protein
MMRTITILAAVFVWSGLAGCARTGGPEPEISAGEPVGLQMLRTEAQLQKYPFRTILEFEAPTDPVFVRMEGTAPRMDSSLHHTGENSLRLSEGCRSLVVRLPSLFSGSVFPGRWALAGAYFFATRPQRLSASYEVEGKALTSITVELPAGKWTPVLLDVASVCDGKDLPIGVLKFDFPTSLSSPLWCDDVVVIENTQTHIESAGPDGWTIRERGFQYALERSGMYKVAIPTPEASGQGWVLGECNALRACFIMPGRSSLRVIYCDGMQIIDGRAVSLDPALSPRLVDQHENPARIEVAAELGRVDRNTSGDANNDGYAEATGTYQLVAAGPRMNLTITPQTPSLAQPVLEIANLPEGKLLVNMEGRAVDKIIRLPSGHTLIALPGTLTRPTQINIRVSQ